MNRMLKSALIVGVVAASAGCATTQFEVYNGLVTSVGEGAVFEEVPMTTIPQERLVIVVTHVRWEPATTTAGYHKVVWKWYKAEKLVAERERSVEFKKTPYRFWYRFPARDFDVGHYHVDVLIDGKVVEAHEFDIVP